VKRQTLFILFFALIAYCAIGQEQYIFSQSARAGAPLERPITAVSFRFEEAPNWLAGKIVADGDTFALRQDPHAEGFRSQLLVFNKPVASVQLLGIETPAFLTGVYAKPLSLPTYYRNFRVAADCEKPAVIPVSVWRAGLTPPRELPTATVVRFIIVHHEAGSNSPSNYANVVRNIYVFHTQSNGWNDVGYNFLVAQDGTVFEGRDGQGRLDGDNVQGAHFCANNAGTMGICLLGNYMTAQPPVATLESLAKLVAWKMKKENLTDPAARALHAPSGRTLVTLSAHRDGTCATDCPGDNLYAKLDALRTSVTNTCDGLKPPIVTSITAPLVWRLYPNPSSDGFFTLETPTPIRTLRVANLAGQVMLQEHFSVATVQYSFQIKALGTFVITTNDQNNVQQSQSVVVLR